MRVTRKLSTNDAAEIVRALAELLKRATQGNLSAPVTVGTESWPHLSFYTIGLSDTGTCADNLIDVKFEANMRPEAHGTLHAVISGFVTIYSNDKERIEFENFDLSGCPESDDKTFVVAKLNTWACKMLEKERKNLSTRTEQITKILAMIEKS